MFNKATLVGRLTKDPVVKEFSGGKLVNLSVATSESFKDKATGEYKDKSEFHNVTVFGEGVSGYIERNMAKGDLVFIEGKIETRSYDKDGGKVYTTSIVVQGPQHAIKKLTPGGGGGTKSPIKSDGDGIPF